MICKMGIDNITVIVKETSHISTGGDMVFNVTFNNISIISWRSILLVEETGVPGENHLPSASHR